MALTTVSSDRLSTNVKNTNFTAAEKQDLTDDILPLAGQLGNRNLIINGAMQVAQRGTSSSATGNQFLTLDRFRLTYNGQDEALTQEQADVASGTTPYSLGFRKCFKLTNGNQTSGAGATDYARIGYAIEARDLATSGWNYTSASSYLTFSFWIKSSVAQSFKVDFYAECGSNPAQDYSIDTGSLSADTWTKVTKTIPGNSNLTFVNTTVEGLHIRFLPFFGTDYTNNSVTENAWGAYSSSARTKDNTSTWWTTNDATFEITGVQLEVGSVATEFEHRSFDQELQSCFRYCQVFDSVDGEYNRFAYANAASGSSIRVIFPLMREMRAKPSVAFSGNFQCPGVGSFNISNVIMESNTGSRKVACLQQGSVSTTNHNTYQFNANNDTSATVTYTAEL